MALSAAKLAWQRKNRAENPGKYNEAARKRAAEYRTDPAYREYQKEYGKAWRDANRDQQQDYFKEYHSKNREVRNAKMRDYQSKNQESISAKRQSRLATDIQFKLGCNLRSRLATAIKDGARGGSAVDDLGCSIPELKDWLERQFEQGMTWDNWSRTGWHIDHDTPLSAFDLTDPEQVGIACHFTNLKPMWAKDNISKGASMPKSTETNPILEDVL